MYWITNWKTTKNSTVIPAEGEFSTKIDPPPTKDLVLQTSEENIAPVLRKALQQREQALGSCRQL